MTILKKTHLILLVSIFLFSNISVASDERDQQKSETSIIMKKDITPEIQEANNEFMQAYNAHDANKLATNTFSSRAIIYPPGSAPVTGGTDVIEGFWNAVIDSGVAKADIKTTEAHAYGDMAIETGTVQLYDAEDNLLDSAKYMVQWEKEGDQWKIVKDIWNSSNQ